MRVLLDHDRCTLFHGDSSRLGEVLAPNTVDAIVCDPPAGVGFMGAEWDRDKGGRDAWIKWLADLLAPSFRALKPGGHALFWALPRTSHWTATAVEEAGFQVRDVIMWLYGSGFPKSLDVSKAIDKNAGHWRGRAGAITTEWQPAKGVEYERTEKGDPVTAAAAAWDGWGTALKPACEHWILARKPLESTVAANVLRYGTGALNIDASRIGDELRENAERAAPGGFYNVGTANDTREVGYRPCVGRWPANLVLSHHAECREAGLLTDEHVVRVGEKLTADSRDLAFGMGRQATTTTTTRIKYECHVDCPVRMLDEQTGAVGAHGGDVNEEYAAMGYKNGARGSARAVAKSSGGASRFFYCAKPHKSETELGLDHLPARTGGEATDREDGSAGLNSPRAGAGRGGGARNFHPTKKPVELMRYLCKLITRPGGVILDPFAGSGTTGVAALAEGFCFVGVELTEDYLPILYGRIRHALGIPVPGAA